MNPKASVLLFAASAIMVRGQTGRKLRGGGPRHHNGKNRDAPVSGRKLFSLSSLTQDQLDDKARECTSSCGDESGHHLCIRTITDTYDGYKCTGGVDDTKLFKDSNYRTCQNTCTQRCVMDINTSSFSLTYKCYAEPTSSRALSDSAHQAERPVVNNKGSAPNHQQENTQAAPHTNKKDQQRNNRRRELNIFDDISSGLNDISSGLDSLGDSTKNDPILGPLVGGVAETLGDKVEDMGGSVDKMSAMFDKDSSTMDKIKGALEMNHEMDNINHSALKESPVDSFFDDFGVNLFEKAKETGS